MKRIINTSNAPAPIGPYSQAVVAGNMLYISGAIALEAATGALKNSSIEEETHQVMRNLQYILEAAGAKFENVVKTTIFLTDLSNFAKVNEVYGSYLSGDYPARETVEVSRLPRDVNVEISMIAVLG
jgi:2-iminobutanoate/2-iminopropanoate deaminase